MNGRIPITLRAFYGDSYLIDEINTHLYDMFGYYIVNEVIMKGIHRYGF